MWIVDEGEQTLFSGLTSHLTASFAGQQYMKPIS